MPQTDSEGRAGLGSTSDRTDASRGNAIRLQCDSVHRRSEAGLAQAGSTRIIRQPLMVAGRAYRRQILPKMPRREQ